MTINELTIQCVKRSKGVRNEYNTLCTITSLRDVCYWDVFGLCHATQGRKHHKASVEAGQTVHDWHHESVSV